MQKLYINNYLISTYDNEEELKKDSKILQRIKELLDSKATIKIVDKKGDEKNDNKM